MPLWFRGFWQDWFAAINYFRITHMTIPNDQTERFRDGFRDLFSVKGKVAVVTGGSKGIGEMISAGFLAGGAKVYISSRSVDVCNATAQRLSNDFGGECISLPMDLSSVKGCQALADVVAERESRLDILVNNAGTGRSANLDDFTEEQWDVVFNTNVKGVFFLTQKMLPLLRKSGTHEDPARVINIGSVDGIKNAPWLSFSYPPSKAAIHRMTRMLAHHLIKDNIIVNTIAPGPFPTDMLSRGFGGDTAADVDWEKAGRGGPRGRFGTPEDIAGLAIFLSSRAGAFTVGEVITCDGGYVYAT